MVLAWAIAKDATHHFEQSYSRIPDICERVHFCIGYSLIHVKLETWIPLLSESSSELASKHSKEVRLETVLCFIKVLAMLLSETATHQVWWQKFKHQTAFAAIFREALVVRFSIGASTL